MNKSELIDAVSGQTGVAKTDAARAVDAVFDAIGGALKSGDSVALVGFGTFAVKTRAARSGRNPRTGETIEIAASNMPVFKAGKALKDAVNWRASKGSLKLQPSSRAVVRAARWSANSQAIPEGA